MAKVNKSEKVPKNMQDVFGAIVALTDDICTHHLSDEYAQLARYATAALCRKRPSPLAKGRTNTWACGVVYAMGFVNFLFDRDNEPYVTAADLCGYFGVSKSTGAAKSKIIRDTLDLTQLDPNWCLPSRLGSNPMAWMISLDGFIVDVRDVSREIQEIAYEKGLIPYIPADKNE